MSPAASAIADNELQGLMRRFGEQAVAAQATLARSTSASRDAALREAARAVRRQTADILAANAEDMQRGADNGLAAPLMDRLELTGAGIDGMLEGLRQVASLPDPVGAITDMNTMPSGIQVGRMRVPLGVIGIIYESRPNVTVEAASLCLKSGNAAILRGGSARHAHCTNDGAGHDQRLASQRPRARVVDAVIQRSHVHPQVAQILDP